MNVNFDEIEQAALQLPLKERAALANRILETLDDEMDESVRKAWEEELERRYQAMQSGEMATKSVDQVFSEAFGKIR